MTKLAILGGSKTIEESGPHHIWPRITKSVEEAVVKQLHSTISIYNRSGVIKDFEDEFADYHGCRFALLSNSGTNAIFSMYEGLKLGPGDEVICPVYTFFATVSPLMHTGAKPVFCDCDANGNIDPAMIEELITQRTKAVVVTHMWGMPCDMESISSICSKNGLLLLEDCSHAHGARIGGRLVGTFGDAAAWSLQGQKTVTGGEGGIMLTNNEEVYYRAQLQGHYNKRCKQEIPSDHELCAFSTTGFGLKFRAHPLAVAIAQEQFSHLEEWLVQRQSFAERMSDVFGQFTFLRTPRTIECSPSWYAYVMQFDEFHAHGIDVELFTKAVLAEGLSEFDRPMSTGVLSNLPLFVSPELALPRLYPQSVRVESVNSYPAAERFYKNALKLPVWSFPDEGVIVDKYIEGVSKVASVVQNNPEALLALYSGQ
ncbi:DegT/DnrJ/EryC1/StrS family aminotransferase [Candidatus Kaiserbacteria bacterium]|nr:DegT/DnrJ/EryC1/StrS family aminotransferase [Candidatus Kaiserbacteria bacterium]